MITGFDIVFSETDENDDDFNSIFANAVQLTSVSYASAMASNALNNDPIVDTPAWAVSYALQGCLPLAHT